MANSVPFRATPQLGPQLDDVFTGLPYWDLTGVQEAGAPIAGITSPSYKLGNVEMGDDGREYIWVQASADIAATANTGTQVTITVPAYTVATGAGGYYTPANTAITSGQYFHVSRGAKNAVPG
jgi:hypothetical protein